MICAADQFTGQYRSATAFIEALCGAVNIVLAERGARGAEIIDFSWTEETGKPPRASLWVRPGDNPLDAEACRRFLKEKGQ